MTIAKLSHFEICILIHVKFNSDCFALQVHRTSSSREEDRRRSYSSEMEDDRVGHLESEQRSGQQLSSTGSRRRHLFSQGKQYSMPAEVKVLEESDEYCSD